MFDRNIIINRFLIGLISFVMIFILVFSFFTPETYAARTVIMGHAARGESGLTGQKPGDQTGKEVYMTPWSYTKTVSSRNWTVVCRAKDPNKAAVMAKVMRDACENDNVGYDAGTYKERQSFFFALKEAGWDASKITKPVETSCTPLIAATICAAGINIKTDHSASSLYKALQDTGKFVFYTSNDYVASSDKLEVGDILLSTKKAHGAMIVSVNGSTKPTYTKASTTVKTTITTAIQATASQSSSSKFKAGKDYQLKYVMNVRKGPGTNYTIKKYSDMTSGAKEYSIDKSKAILNKGTVVTCIQAKDNWIKIPSGWVCAQSGKTSRLAEYKGTKDQKALEAKAKIGAKSSSQKAVATKSTTTKVAVKQGKDYKLRASLNVRKGAGTNYDIKSRTALTKDARKNSLSNTKKAVLKKGTVVTCIKVKGDWMLIPSGWICCKPGNVAYAS